MQKIKLGSVMPDKILSLKEGMFPTFHGRNIRTLAPEQWREGGLPGAPSEADKKLYYYGMAIHAATDAVAHHSFGWQNIYTG
ncbi:MAG: hypothetical protein HFG34_10135 [Eubacterium sp.]|nr:hypothetical protein [Eubacterium sp.]